MNITLYDAFYLSIALLLVSLGGATYLVSSRIRHYQALRLMRYAAFLDALGWLLFLWTDLEFVHYLSYLFSGLASIPYAVYPDLRKGSSPPKLMIAVLALTCFVGYFITVYVIGDTEVNLHIGTAIQIPIAGYAIYRLVWKQTEILKSHYVFIFALFLMAVVALVRSILMIYFVDIQLEDSLPYMAYWPAIYALLYTSIMISYLEEAHRDEYLRARIDGPTQLVNRISWEECLQQEFDRKMRSKGTVSSLVIFDIDRFKSVNDNYGHTVGDQVISRVAGVLSSQVRDTDIAGRYGGDEFVVLLMDTDITLATAFAERTRMSVEQLIISQGGNKLDITVSIGIAEFHKNIENPTAWLDRADKALYQSKEKGRNCYSTFSIKERIGYF